MFLICLSNTSEKPYLFLDVLVMPPKHLNFAKFRCLEFVSIMKNISKESDVFRCSRFSSGRVAA